MSHSLPTLLQLAEAGEPIPAALRAAAGETRGRRKRADLLELAAKIERGESPSTDRTSERERFFASVASGPAQAIGSLSDYLSVSEGLNRQRTQIRRLLLGTALIMTVALGATMALLVYTNHQIQSMLDEFQLETPMGHYVLWWLCFVLSVGLTWLAWVVYFLCAMRRLPLIGPIATWLLGRIPMVGKTYSTIESSEWSDGISRSLAAGRSYSDSFRETAAVATNPLTAAGLRAIADRLDQGMAIDEVLERQNMSNGLMAAMVSSRTATAPAEGWRLAADNFIRSADRQTRRLRTAFPPVVFTVAAAMAWSGYTIAISRIQVLIGMLGGL
ncbi:Bacterial type II secretion system protein F domain protein [Roseimaritima multifibrata]|uniref:Bacterial type II secretion system protein F domain protein n=1 Tax=Roseimaritima multifibrata TaxID=1930274 RepID=A0A517MEE0_9BACT|nr:type II secretion system F family protein [Roseimaritima multifibrata]QDS93252.1 Bacterial type II secretion system protein F domain protein [Roseimaritima multifibrata]